MRRDEAIQSRNCDIKKPIWYLDNGCSRHMTGVKSYLHKYMEQPGPKVVFRDDSTCVTEGYGSIKCEEIRVYKFNLVYVESIKWVVELPFNARLLSSNRRSHSPRQSSSIFTRLKSERSRAPRHDQKNKARRESNVFERLGSRGRSVSAYSDSRQENSRYTEKHSESDSRGGHWKSNS
ncbi:hypothetical protein Tco_0764454 [Tanacetum coccineum]